MMRWSYVLVSVMIYLVLVPILVFFFLEDREQIGQWFRSYLPRERSLITQVAQEMNQQIANYIRGKFIEIIGQYAPRQTEGGLNVDEDRANYWMNVGAQPSDTVRSLLRRAGILKRRHEARTGRTVTPKTPVVEEQPDLSNVIPISEDAAAEA